MIEAARVRNRGRIAAAHWDVPWAGLKIVVMKTRRKVHCTQGELAHRGEMGCGHLQHGRQVDTVEEVRSENEQRSKMEGSPYIGNFSRLKTLASDTTQLD